MSAKSAAAQKRPNSKSLVRRAPLLADQERPPVPRAFTLEAGARIYVDAPVLCFGAELGVKAGRQINPLLAADLNVRTGLVNVKIERAATETPRLLIVSRVLETPPKIHPG